MVWSFIEFLPPESATKTAQRGEYSDAELAQLATGHREHGAWSQMRFDVAHLIDAVEWNTYVTQIAAGAKNLDKPKPYPRPGIVADGVRAGRLNAEQMRKLADVRPADPPTESVDGEPIGG